MKRYCAGIIYKKEDFLKKDTKCYLDTNFKRLMNLLIDQEKNSGEQKIPESERIRRFLQSLMGNIVLTEDELVKQIDSVSLSEECELDILNEMYLLLLAAEGHKELLFLEDGVGIQLEGRAGVNDRIKNTINNKKSKNPKSDAFIFDRETVTSVRSDVKIDSFGSGVVRLWFSSGEFRNLFVKTDVRHEKYNLSKIQDIISKSEWDGIKYSSCDCIILEKLLGISTGIDVQNFIISYMENQKYDILEPLISVLMKCNGTYSRRAFIQILGLFLSQMQSSGKKYDESAIIKWYTQILEDRIKYFDNRYNECLNTIMKERIKRYSYNTIMEMIQQRKKEILLYGCPVIVQSRIYQEYAERQMLNELVNQIKEKSCTIEQGTELINKWTKATAKLELLSVENRLWRKKLYECPETTDLNDRIQGQIIDENYKKYNK